MPLLSWDVYCMQTYAQSQLPKEDVLQLEKLALLNKWVNLWNFEQKIAQEHKVVVVTDLEQRILFASSQLLSMTGYTPEEVVGKSPKMFQGERTEREITAYIRNAVAQQQPFSTAITNYQKNGDLYTCHIEGYPVFDLEGKLANYIAFEKALA